MARPAMRDPSGRWSLTQVAVAAGITRQTARTLASNNLLGDVTNLSSKDVLCARVAAHLLDAPRPLAMKPADARDAVIKRNFDALALTRRIIDNPTPPSGAVLLITPTTATLHESPFKLMADIEGVQVAVLLVPVGAWAEAWALGKAFDPAPAAEVRS
jgi:hypothetical protein